MNALLDPPAAAACRHLGARDGFEVLFIQSTAEGYRLEGHTSAVEDGQAWAVRYEITVGPSWITRSARVAAQSTSGRHDVEIELDRNGRWRVDGQVRPELDGCMDVDVEASAFTNTLPVRRLALAVGDAADAPAAYVRAPDPHVQRLEQRYARLEDEGGRSRYDYAGPAFDYTGVLVFDQAGLIVDYPGLAARLP